MRHLVVVLAASALGACAPSQPERFCETSADCEPHRLCDMFTRECRMDMGSARTDVDIWGELACWQGGGASNRGFVDIGLAPKAATRLGKTLTGSWWQLTGICQLTHTSSGTWQAITGVYAAPSTGASDFVFAVVVQDASFSAGAVQTPVTGRLFIAAADAAGKVLFSFTTGRIEVSTADATTTPAFMRATFEGGLP